MQAGSSRWSPDGKRIAFVAAKPGRPWRNYIVPAAGGAAQELDTGEGNAVDPDWSPDGMFLAFGTRDTIMLGDPLGTALYTLDLKPAGYYQSRIPKERSVRAGLPMDATSLLSSPTTPKCCCSTFYERSGRNWLHTPLLTWCGREMANICMATVHQC